ncbi:hypothetical protein RD110_02650 [Rhodoferax koreense]|uniref:Lipoprotein n=1 Tax=Rhodoferax koreensis TaxID=1842727 RepID=A0A1P8JR96_9BURK|nr:hypothetical protein [Rhodoferax koreense]APW36245.1 hypothetical protein RD110_02650 [Rhodoferax koreense]
MPAFYKSIALAAACCAAACQPALNWREVRSDVHPLVVLLPCKPDHGSREVPLGGTPVMMDMAGCEAAGATFAVSHARLADAAQVGPVLAGWRAAVLANMRAADATDQPFTPPGAMTFASSLRSRATGQRADGAPVAAQAVWFARIGPGGVDVFHAVVYAQRQDAALEAAADTFFAGLKFP